MEILKIIGGLLVIGALIAAVHAFNQHCYKKFKYEFFSKWVLIAATGAMGSYLIGSFWRRESLATGGDGLNGAVLIGVACLIVIVLIVRNFMKTNLPYGLAGSAIHLVVLPIVANLGLVALLFMVIGGFASLSGNSDSDDDEQRSRDEWAASDLNKDSSNYRFKNDPNSGY